MKLIMKYLKPHVLMVLVCIACLVGQVVCDLTLPNMMSDIVNVGIQQGGLKEEAPKAISEDGMKLIQYFMTGEEQMLMEKGYQFVMPQSSEAMRQAEEYPLVSEEPIYIRSTRDGIELKGLERIYGKATYAMMDFLKGMAGKEGMELPETGSDSQTPPFIDGENKTAPNEVLPESGVDQGDLNNSQLENEESQAVPGASQNEEPQTGSNGSQIENGAGQPEEYTSQSNGLSTPKNVPVPRPQSSFAGIQISNMAVAGETSSKLEGEGDQATPYGNQGESENVPAVDPNQDPGLQQEEPIAGAINPNQTDPRLRQADPVAGAVDPNENTEETAENAGFADMDIKEIYALVSTTQQYSQAEIQQSINASNQVEESMRGQVGVGFTKLFYEEVGIDTQSIQHDFIFQVGMRMIGIALALGVVAIIVGFLSSRIAADVARKLRRDLFHKVESFSSGEYNNFSTASLITRTTNDVQQVQMLVTMGLRLLCYAPMMGVGGILFAVNKSQSLSWIIVLTVVILLGILLVIMGSVMPKFKGLQKLTDRLNLVSRESLSGMLVIRAFGNEGHEEKRFEKANRDLSDTNLFVQKMMSWVMPSMMFMMNVATLLIIWFGSNAIANATLQIGDMMAFVQYAMQVIISFLMIAMMFVFVPRALVSAKRISEVLDTKNNIEDPKTPKTLPQVKGKVQFDHVSFQYPGAEEKVLEDISFTANTGETTAFIGSTGSGKSTLVNLIPRFYEVTEGSITIDGTDIRELQQHDLREKIGYVPQKGLLFSGNIATNLQYGKDDATEEEMHHALKIAQAEEFVYAEEEGTALPISQGGTNVSGGQRQRLSIARALIKRSPIYIFDDSFSALDFKTDAKLRRALRQDTEESTMLIVAQRVSTIMHAEQIVVLDKGKIVGKSTHKELLKNCPEYREIAESQLAKEELA